MTEVLIVIWTLVNLAGTAIMAHLLREAVLDRRALDAAGAVNGRRVVAAGNVRNCWVRLVVMGMFTMVGLLAFSRAVFDVLPTAVTTQVIRTALVGAAVLLTWDAWLDRRLVKSMWPTGDRR